MDRGEEAYISKGTVSSSAVSVNSDLIKKGDTRKNAKCVSSEINWDDN